MTSSRCWFVGKAFAATVAVMTASFVVGCSKTGGWNEAAQNADPQGYILHLERLLRRDLDALKALQRDLEAAIHDLPPTSTGDVQQQSNPGPQVLDKGVAEQNFQQQAAPKAEEALKSVRGLLFEIEEVLKELDTQRQVVKDRLNSVPSEKVVVRVRELLDRAQRLMNEDPMRTVLRSHKVLPQAK